MAVTATDLAAIDAMLASGDAGPGVASALRRDLPHLAWTSCDSADVVEPPFRSYVHFDLHLLDTADHCAQITTDPARATGIILARRVALS